MSTIELLGPYPAKLRSSLRNITAASTKVVADNVAGSFKWIINVGIASFVGLSISIFIRKTNISHAKQTADAMRWKISWKNATLNADVPASISRKPAAIVRESAW